MNETSFPPFIPAKPKGGVAAEIAASKDMAVQPLTAAEVVGKPKRKRRTAAEIWQASREAIPEAANGAKRKKPKPRTTTVPVDSLVAFAGLTTEEIEQVINVCDAINTFPKQARKRIAAAIGQLFS